MNLSYERYFHLAKHHLGERKNVAKALPYLEQFPEILDIHIGELNAVLGLFERYRRSETLCNPELFPNAEYLARMLGDELLPPWEEIQQKLVPNPDEITTKELDAIFKSLPENNLNTFMPNHTHFQRELFKLFLVKS